MNRRTTIAVTLLSTALALPAATACKVQMSANAGEKKKEPPPPPPPPPKPAPKPEPKPEPAPEPKAPPQVKKSGATVKGDSISIPGAIVFDTGKATLKKDSGSEETLERLRLYLEEAKDKVAMLRIEGHTDNVGKPEDNLELSGKRALTIKTWLIDHGVAKERLIAVGFGETKPVAPNTTDEGKAKNRRTEFKIAKTFSGKGKPVPYMGMKVDGGGKVFE